MKRGKGDDVRGGCTSNGDGTRVEGRDGKWE